MFDGETPIPALTVELDTYATGSAIFGVVEGKGHVICRHPRESWNSVCELL